MFSVYRFLIILVSLISIFSQGIHSSTINLFLKPAPEEVQQEVAKELEELHKKTGVEVGRKLFDNGLKQKLPSLSGFIALYGGYVDYSNIDGNISFPILQKKPKIDLIIAPKIELTIVHGNTISHKNFVPDTPTKIYRFRKRNGNSSPYWNVKEVEKPEHNRMSPLSIVLLTHPNNIVVPVGNFLTTKTPNLTLPKIYVTGNANNAHAWLNFLDINNYFEQIEIKDKIDKKTNITQQLIQNIL